MQFIWENEKISRHVKQEDLRGRLYVALTVM